MLLSRLYLISDHRRCSEYSWSRRQCGPQWDCTSTLNRRKNQGRIWTFPDKGTKWFARPVRWTAGGGSLQEGSNIDRKREPLKPYTWKNVNKIKWVFKMTMNMCMTSFSISAVTVTGEWRHFRIKLIEAYKITLTSFHLRLQIITCWILVRHPLSYGFKYFLPAFLKR